MQSQWHIHARSPRLRAIFLLPPCAFLARSFTLAGAIAFARASADKAGTKIEAKCRERGLE